MPYLRRMVHPLLLSIALSGRSVAQRSYTFDTAMVGDGQMGFAGRSLRKLLNLSIKGVPANTCTNITVKFTPYADGKVAPSPAIAVWGKRRGDASETCFVETAWKLADEPGDQRLEAVILEHIDREDKVRSDPLTLRAEARALPELMIGLADFFSELPLDTLTVSDSRLTAATAARRHRFGGIVGADFPLWPFSRVFLVDHLRLLLGVTTAHPDREFLLGLSLFP